MAEPIGELLVGLGLDTDQKSFKQADAALASIGRGMASLAATVGAGLGFKAVVGDVMDVQDRVGKFSRTVGATTREVSGLRYAFDQMGGSTSDAESSLTRMQALVRGLRIGDSGTTGALDAASLWGFDVEEFQKQATDSLSALYNIADQVQGKSLDAQNGILEAMGLGGVGQFNLLTQGSSGINGLLASYDRLNPVTQEFTTNMENLKGSMTELGAAVDGLKSQVVNDAAPDFINALTGITDVLVDSRETLADILNWNPKEFGDGIGESVRQGIKDRTGVDTHDIGATIVDGFKWAGVNIFGMSREEGATDYFSTSGKSYLPRGGGQVMIPDGKGGMIPVMDALGGLNAGPLSGAGGALPGQFRLLDSPVNEGKRKIDENYTAVSGEIKQAGFMPSTSGGDLTINDLLASVAVQESGGRHRDASGALIRNKRTGAFGQYQIMPGTAAQPGFGVDPLRNDSKEENERFAGDYLRSQLRYFKGDVSKTLAAYNWGPGNVEKAAAKYGDDWLNYAPEETRNYVPSVLGRLGGGSSSSVDQQVTIRIDGAQNPQAIAEQIEQHLRRSAQQTGDDLGTRMR